MCPNIDAEKLKLPKSSLASKMHSCELDWQFKVIREVGKDLGLEGADTIGWRLIHSVMSDQASTQKAFNRLVKERADLEIEERGLLETTGNGQSILETFCGMHLGVNLRTAEVQIL